MDTTTLNAAVELIAASITHTATVNAAYTSELADQGIRLNPRS